MNWTQLIASFFGSVGFALLFHLKGKSVLWTSLGGFFSWFVYLGVGIVHPSYGLQILCAGVFLGMYTEIMAIFTKMPRTAYIAVGIIPLIPGAALYRMMYHFFMKSYRQTLDYGVEALVTSVAIGAGLLLAMVVWKLIRPLLGAGTTRR